MPTFAIAAGAAAKAAAVYEAALGTVEFPDATDVMMTRATAIAAGADLLARLTPADIDALNQKIIYLEQQAIDLRLQLEEQGEDLAAARATNRELIAQLNTTAKNR
jgi:hypothetical protein